MSGTTSEKNEDATMSGIRANAPASMPAPGRRRPHAVRRWILGIVIVLLAAYAVCYGVVVARFAQDSASYREYWAAYEPAQQAAEEFAPVLEQCEGAREPVAAPERIERSGIADARPSLWLGTLVSQNATMGRDLAVLKDSTRAAVWFVDGGQAAITEYGCDATV